MVRPLLIRFRPVELCLLKVVCSSSSKVARTVVPTARHCPRAVDCGTAAFVSELQDLIHLCAVKLRRVGVSTIRHV